MTFPLDFLANRPARPGTKVPGHWLLPLPSPDAQLHIRRFGIATTWPARGGTALEKLRDDPLERAWHKVNTATSDEEGMMRGGCATVVRPEAEGEKGRELWCFGFEDDTGHLSLLEESLEEILPALEPMNPADLFSCPQHGHDLSCLRSRTATCSVQYKPTFDLETHWELFTDAVVEKVAWKAGRRMVMRPGSMALSPGPPVRAMLRPLATPQLLLDIHPKPPPRCRSLEAGSQLPRHLCPLLLQPLGIPALLLGPQAFTPEQDGRIRSTFDIVLGSAWKEGRSQRRFDAQLANESFSDWSAYWVPLLDQTLDPSGVSPVQLAASWQQLPGVITIWPTHLSNALSSPPLESERKLRDPPTLIGLPTSDDLMGVAAGVYELLSNYREPQAVITPAADVAAVDREDVEKAEESSIFGDDEEPEVGAEADFDDLFSVRSDSPGPPEPLEPVPPVPEEAEVDELFEGVRDLPPDFGDDVVMGSPPPAIVTAEHHSMEPGDVRNLVTEDDFDFFDSPADAAEEELPPTEQTVAPPPGPVATADRLEPLEVDIPAAPTGKGHLETMVMLNSPTQRVTQPKAVVDAPEPYPPSPTRGSTISTKRDRDQHEIIPSPFEPLPLESASQLPSSAYSLPSPAPTPESLRPELVDRLRQSKKAKHDYAAAWEINSDSPELDDEEDQDYSGAPPTPESEVYSEDTQSGLLTPPKLFERATKTEIEFGGIACVGAEWFSLTGDRETAINLGRAWNTAWVEAGSSAANTVVLAADRPKVRLEVLRTLDLDRFGSELIANRHFRNIFTPSTSPFPPDSLPDLVPTCQPLIQPGVDLASLAHSVDEEVTTIRKLPPCSIHTGFSGNVMRLSVAGLRYWAELGLEPISGKKDITVFLICEVGDGSLHAGQEFLRKMGQVYKQLRLGSQKHGEAPMATKGIVSLPLAGFPDTISSLLARHTHNTVIYVLLSDASLSISPQRIFSIAPPTSPTSIVFPVPTAALQDRKLQNLAFEVYDRLPRLVKRVADQGFPMDEPPAYLKYPRFTLAPDHTPKPALTLAWPLRNYDVLNRWRFVHAAYGYDQKTEMLVALAADAEGESWDVKTWREVSPNAVGEHVERLWDFFSDFADSAAIEWRLTVTRLGSMRTDESGAWHNLLASKKAPTTLLMVEPPPPPGRPFFHPRTSIPHVTAATLADPATRIIDESLLAQTVKFPNRFPLDLPNTKKRGSTTSVCSISTFLLSVATNGDFASALYHVISHRPAPGKEDEVADDVLSRDFYRLVCLGRSKFGFEGGLPAHLEGVRVVLEGIEAFASEAAA